MLKTLSQHKTLVVVDLCLYLAIFYCDKVVFCRDRVHLLIFILLCCDRVRIVAKKFYAICLDQCHNRVKRVTTDPFTLLLSNVVIEKLFVAKKFYFFLDFSLNFVAT